MFSFQFKNLDIAHKQDFASSPSDEYGKHMHPFCEVVFFLNGEVDYCVDGDKRHLRRGDIVFVHPGKFHFANVGKKIIYERFVLKFPESIIPDHMKEKTFGSSAFYHMDKSQFSLFTGLDDYAGRLSDEDMYFVCLGRLMEFFVFCNNTQQISLDEDDSVVSHIVRYIDSHLEENLTLSNISDALSYSESYISNCFKREMHTPLMKYIRSKKIIYAHSLILQGNKPQVVAEALNFNDYSTFYRQYRKVIGLSPSEDKS